MTDLARYVRDPAGFIDDLVQKNELGQPWRLFAHDREILRLAFTFDEDGRLPWDTILWSCIKKDGKSWKNAVVVVWWGFTQEAPNEIDIRSNDLEQSLSRVFRMVVGLLRHNPVLGRSAKVQADRILLSNGTMIRAVPQDWKGESGGNQGLISFDELWAYTSENARRAWDEAPPVPTRKNSIRLVTTYAGIQGESALLEEQYKRGVGKEEHPEGQGERIHATLPVYANREARFFVYWDHEARMPWQTPEYLAARQRDQRPNTYLRQYENRWVTAESVFITEELWDACVDPSVTPLLPAKDCPLFVGVDAGIKHDSAAVVAVRRDEDIVVLAAHCIWKPSPREPLDLEATIETYLRDLHERYSVRAIYCDPYQLHRSITTLWKAGLRIEEFPQSEANTTRMGNSIYELLKGKNLRLYPSDELRQQALSTVGVEKSRGFRIAKERASKKIDAIVALAMACVAALDKPVLPPLRIVAGGVFPTWSSEEAQRVEDERNREAEETVRSAIAGRGAYFPGDFH